MRNKEGISVAKNTQRCLLMLTLMAALLLLFPGLPSASAAANGTVLVYQVKYASERLATPTDWYNSRYFNNPDAKENRFVQYWVETPIAPGGSRDTGLYMVYNEEGLTIFVQSNEPEREANGVLKNSSIEMFLQPVLDGVPYHQLIVQTNDSPFEYYEWQTENRHNRPLEGNVIVKNEELPTGWGTVVQVPWETFYDHVPLDGEDWKFSMIRWAPGGFSPTWGGHVHQVGRFNTLDFQAPTAEQRTAIQKSIIRKAWDKFNATALQLRATWHNGDPDDERFYQHDIEPLIARGQANGSQIPNLDSLSATEIDGLYRHVSSWFELRYDAEDARVSYIQNSLFRGNEPPTVTDATYVTMKNTPVSGGVAGTDPDGDALAYSLDTAPAHGTVALDVYGRWTYTPSADYTGTDRFTVKVSDPQGEYAISSIALTVTPGPATTAVLNPASPDGANGWYTSDVTVTLAAYDDVVGVANTAYSLDNGGSWHSYTNPLVFDHYGEYAVSYRSTDLAGNTEPAHTITFRIDKTAPTAAVTYSSTAPTSGSVTAVLTPSEPVTITNNGGSGSYTFDFNGSFTFEFVDAAGNRGSQTATVTNIVAKSTGAPGKPVLSHDNESDAGLRDGNYNVTMNMWWGNNGNIYALYENDVLIDRRILADNAPSAQSAVTSVTYKMNGTYRYYAELTNAYGTTRSDVLTVAVTQAAPAKPVLSNDNWDHDGNFQVSMNMWWGTNGATYRLYENGVLIDAQTLGERTPQAQSAATAIRNKPAGTYVYRCELVNYAGAASSEEMTVVVAK